MVNRFAIGDAVYFGDKEGVIIGRAGDDQVQVKFRDGHTEFLNISQLAPVIYVSTLKGKDQFACPFCQQPSSEVKMEEERHIGKCYQCEKCSARFYQDDFSKEVIGTIVYKASKSSKKIKE